MAGYTQKQVSKITELTPRLVQFYTDEGLVVPEIDRGEGRGKVKRYSKTNLFFFLFIKALSDHGIRLREIGHYVGLLHLALVQAVAGKGASKRKLYITHLFSKKLVETYMKKHPKSWQRVYYVIGKDTKGESVAYHPLTAKDDTITLTEIGSLSTAIIINLGDLFTRIKDV